jgi:putative glycosyltransferase (TIGR04372 family)
MEVHLELRPKKSYVILAPDDVTEHKWFLHYLSERGFYIVRNPNLAAYARSYLWRTGKVLLTNDYCANESTSSDFFKLSKLCVGKRFPFFSPSTKDKDYLSRFLNQCNAPTARWIATLHLRFPSDRPQDLNGTHFFRNTTPESYRGLDEFIWERGGILIRVGDATPAVMGPKLLDIPQILNGKRDCRLDLSIVSNSKIFIGCNSGMYGLATVFDIPCALVNMTPAAGAGSANDIVLYKKLFDKKDSKFIKIDDTLKSILTRADFYRQIPDWHKRYEFIDNEPSAVQGCVAEILESLDSHQNDGRKNSAPRISELVPIGSYPYHSLGRLSKYNW